MVCSICPPFPYDFYCPQTDPRTPYPTDVLLLRCCLSPWHESRQVVVGRQRPLKAEQSVFWGRDGHGDKVFFNPKMKEKRWKATECWNERSCRDFLLSRLPTSGQNRMRSNSGQFLSPPA